MGNFVTLQAVMPHICKFCISALFGQLFFLVNIAYMPRYNRLVTLKQLCHLCLSKPHGLILHAHLKAYGLVGLVEDNLAFGLRPGYCVQHAVVSRVHLTTSSFVLNC